MVSFIYNLSGGTLVENWFLDFDSNFTEYSLTLIQGISFGKLGVDTNLGYTFYPHPELWKDEVKNNWNIGVALKYSLLTELTLVGEATKMIVQGDYLDDTIKNHVLFRGGIVYEGFGFPVDLAVYSMPQTGEHYGLTFGLTIPIE